MKLHPSITTKRVMQAVEAQMTTLENLGFCIYCGEDADGCEPDARQYECECCGRRGVYGADELLMHMV